MKVGDRYEVEIRVNGKTEVKRGTITHVQSAGRVAILSIDGRKVSAFSSQLKVARADSIQATPIKAGA